MKIKIYTALLESNVIQLSLGRALFFSARSEGKGTEHTHTQPCSLGRLYAESFSILDFFSGALHCNHNRYVYQAEAEAVR